MAGIFALDIETLGMESTAVIASIGMVYYDQSKPLTYNELLSSSIYLKLDVRSQIKKYSRTTDPDTLAWWKNQSKEAQLNIIPDSKDKDPLEAMRLLSTWVQSHNDWKNTLVFVRGTLDQLCTESLCRVLGVSGILPFWNFRDVRTFIDCFYPESNRGQVDVDMNKVKDFNMNNVIKHSPVHDCCLDICQMIGGIV